MRNLRALNEEIGCATPVTAHPRTSWERRRTDMYEDPIVADVRRAGEELAAEANYDVHQFFENLRAAEKKYTERLVNTVPQSDAASVLADTARRRGAGVLRSSTGHVSIIATMKTRMDLTGELYDELASRRASGAYQFERGMAGMPQRAQLRLRPNPGDTVPVEERVGADEGVARRES